MSARRRVAFLTVRNAHEMLVLKGVSRYAQEHGQWLIHQGNLKRDGLKLALDWKAEGLVVYMRNADRLKELAACPVPVVNFASGELPWDVPQVAINDLELGRLAAEHLLSRGFRRLAFYSDRTSTSVDDRQAGFTEAAREAGVEALVERVSPTDDWRRSDEAVCQWLKSLPLPIGIGTPNPIEARMLSEACLQAGVQVPERCALVAMDGLADYCEVSHPPLSGVELPWDRVGYEAAGLLERLIDGEPPPTEPIRLPPLRVITRRSSDTTAVDDDDVARALHVIRERGLDVDFNLASLADSVFASRRAIEVKMKRLIGRTPGAELRRVRCEQAKHLLIDTDLDMPGVARACGFPSAATFGITFRKEVGQTPSAYRQASRLR